VVRAAARPLRVAVCARAVVLSTGLLSQLGGAAPLPYQTPDQHLGVASCASSLCHGSVSRNPHYDVQLNEYVTWSHQDAHAKAFQALTSELGRSIASKLGLPSADQAKACLDCHSDNIAPSQRGKRFSLADGVGCEACHGGAERWIAAHATPKATYRDDVGQGMYPSADLAERALLCDSCHVGNADKLATHNIMGAGHPRLAFELDTYLALEPPHYSVDASYRRRKPAFNHAQTWAEGQLQASLSQLGLLQGASLRMAGVFPELALFNCSSCHDSSMQRLEWRRRQLTQLTAPGMVPLNDAYWRMSWMIARALDPAEGLRVLGLGQDLQRSVMLGRDQVAARADALAQVLRVLQKRVADEAWAASQTTRVLESILKSGIDGEFRDYLGAEQAVMAMELLLIDSGQEARLRSQLDKLYGLLKNVDTYRSEDFIPAMQALKAAL
jgi:hypothetical protein